MRNTWKVGVVGFLGSALLGMGGCSQADPGGETPQSAELSSSTPVSIQFLSVSDWHAQLDPLTVNGVAIGGAPIISAYWQADRAANPNTLSLTAGDAFGASPPLSGFFDDTPAILA